MKRLLTLLAACLLATALQAQYRNPVEELDDSETVRSLKEHVATLSAAQMEGRGELWALDANAGRLKNLAHRRVRAAPNAPIRTQVIPEEFDAARDAPKLRGRCGCVLIDAPCSGTGVLRRSPDAKSRFEAPEMIDDFARRQTDILSRHSALVRPGGRLVYATCSVLKAEDEDVVQSFLSAHPDFRLLDTAGCLPEAASPLVRGGFLRTLPHKDGCDGFFGAVMERAGS